MNSSLDDVCRHEWQPKGFGLSSAPETSPSYPGGYGTSIGSALEGKATLARTADHKLDWAFLRPEEPAKFIEGTGKVMNTVPPNDFRPNHLAPATSFWNLGFFRSGSKLGVVLS